MGEAKNSRGWGWESAFYLEAEYLKSGEKLLQYFITVASPGIKS